MRGTFQLFRCGSRVAPLDVTVKTDWTTFPGPRTYRVQPAFWVLLWSKKVTIGLKELPLLGQPTPPPAARKEVTELNESLSRTDVGIGQARLRVWPVLSTFWTSSPANRGTPVP